MLDSNPEGKSTVQQWDSDQELVITALPTDRLVVDAGPGTGKTEVACARVAYLIDTEGCEPSYIWLVSFTRTAVAELRQRIATYMDDPEDAHSVRIATLDSHAWSLHSGFDPEVRMDGGYDSNITQFTDRLRQDSEVQEYVGSIRHLIIDEAQDIVGIRAELVEEILKHLHAECGVTIFADQAQSIYGFSSDDVVDRHTGTETLVERLGKAGSDNAFDHLSLNQIFRTESERLLKIFTNVRQCVLEEKADSASKLREVVETIKQLADGEPDEEFSDELRERDDLLILYRRRGETLFASSQLRQRGVPHRLRMSGMPICVRPWIALCFAEHVEPILTRQRFSTLWDTIPGEHGDEEAAWAALVRFAGKTANIVDMTRLTTVLGRKRPPAEFCLPDFGTSGPILGTIHASKGREAPAVHLMLPPLRDSPAGSNLDEETRVIFVGATRAKTELLVGEGDRRYYQSLESSGRVYRCLKSEGGRPRAQVEIGHEFDVGATEIAGRQYFQDSSDVYKAQQKLRQLDIPLPVCALSQHDKKYAYAVIPERGDGDPIAYLASQVNRDMFEIGRRVVGRSESRKTRPPLKIPHLSVVGVCSVVLTHDSTERGSLHQPWSASGIMLAPLVVGFTTVSFPFQRYRKW